MAPLTVEDLSLIKALWIGKSWAVDRMIAKSPARQWQRRTLYHFVRRIYSTRSVDRLPGSGRRCSVKTDSNIKLVSDLILSQGWQPGISKSPREITRETGISHSSVVRNCQELFAAQCFDAVKFSPWQHADCGQTETIECMQAFEETYY